MKKLGTLFLSVMMLATCLFAIPAQATETAEIVNLIPNADFENIDATTGLPVGWSYLDNSMASAMENSVEAVTADDKAKGVVGDKKLILNKPSSQSAVDVYINMLSPEMQASLVPGTEYTFSVKYKMSTNTCWTFMRVFSASQGGNWDYSTIGETSCFYSTNVWRSAAGAWDTYTYTFTFIEQKSYLRLPIRLPNNRYSKYEFADVSLMGQMKEKGNNIAPNADFSELDADGLPVGWAVEGKIKANSGYTLYKGVQAIGPEGENAIVLEARDANNNAQYGVGADISLDLNHRQLMVPGQTYNVSLQYYVTGGSHSLSLISSNSPNVLPAANEVDADGVNMYPATPGINGVKYGETKNVWITMQFTYTVSRHTPYHWISFKSGNEGASSIKIANIKIEGIRRANSDSVYGSEILTNGGFANGSEDWTLSDDFVLKTEGTNTVVALPNVGDYAEITFPVGTSKVYEVQADVKSSVSGSLKADISTAPETATNIEKGKPFYDRVMHYSYTFVDSGSVWKKIKFNIYPMSTSKEVTVCFENAVADTALMIDNVSVKPTKELISNGDFEGLAFAEKTAFAADGTTAISDGIPGWPVAFTNNGSEGKYGTVYGESGTGAMLAVSKALNSSTDRGVEPYLTQKIPMESGKTYKVVYSLKTTHQYCPQAGWHTNTYGGVSDIANQGWHTITANTWTTFTKYYTMPTVDAKGEEWLTQDTAWEFRWAGRSQLGSYYIDNVSIQEVANGANFYNVNGEKYNSLSEAKGKTIYSYFASADLPQDTEISLISALYDVSSGTPMLVDATVTKGKNSMNAPIFGTIDIPDYEGTYKLSVFCLDSITGLKALEAKYDFE